MDDTISPHNYLCSGGHKARGCWQRESPTSNYISCPLHVSEDDWEICVDLYHSHFTGK